MLVLRITHRIWKGTKQEPGTAGPGNMLGCCLVSFHFLSAILSTSTVSAFPTHPIERVVEPGKREQQDVGVERGEGRSERLHDAEDEMETVKGHQP